MHISSASSRQGTAAAVSLSPESTSAPKTRLAQNDLSTRWGISSKTLERWRVLGIGPCFLKLGGKVVYRLEDVEAYERHSLRQSTSEAAHAGGAA
jgi:hypothetical protein